MKKLLVAGFAVLLLAALAHAGPFGSGGNTASHNQSLATDWRFGAVSVGATYSDKLEHTYFEANRMANSNGVTEPMVAFSVQIVSNTAGSEQVIDRHYGWDPIHAGVYGMTYSNKEYTATPSGSETPVDGCRVIATCAWNPLSVSSCSKPYGVEFCGGATWAAPGACQYQ